MSWRTAMILCLLVAAVASGWSVWRQTHPQEEVVLRTRPDYVLHDYQIISLDKAGKESFTLTGPRLQRDPADKTMTLITPQFQVPDREQRYWNVRAQHGFVPAGGGQLQLRGQVIAISPAQAPPPTRIETESLTLLLGDNHAQTSDAVTITQPGLTMRGIGMRADLDRQHVSLLSQVKARYVPQH
jgi:lipopolysaccharide export system protein LptC